MAFYLALVCRVLWSEEGAMSFGDITRSEEINELLEAVTTLATRANQLATNAEERQHLQDVLVMVEGLTDDLVTELELQVINLRKLIRAYEQPRS
jgi:hypothetical protein